MQLLRDVLQGLDEPTLAYLATAVDEMHDADDEALAELFGPFCDELGVAACEKQRLFEGLAVVKESPPRLAVHAVSSVILPSCALRDLLGDPPSDTDASGDGTHAVAEVAGARRASGKRAARCTAGAMGGVDQGSEPAGPAELEDDEDQPWLSGSFGVVEDQMQLPSWAKRLFAGAWREELRAWPRRWSSCQVALLAASLSPKAAKVAAMIESNSIDGCMCLASGLDMLVEKLSGLRRADLDASKVVCRRLVEWMHAFDVDCSMYSDLLSHPNELTMLRSFSGTLVEPLLRRVLRPAHPRYVVVEPREAKVKPVDAELQQLWGSDLDGSEDIRVAVVLRDGLVQTSLIYVRQSTWWLVASVDFAHHGEAAPGHWHINRTPSGDRVEHWGPRGAVFHGTCWNCPLWWLVIPAGLEYASRPLRLDLLPTDAFGEADAH